MKKILFSGFTTEDGGHRHRFHVYDDYSVVVGEARHPHSREIKHGHLYEGAWPSGDITEEKSTCYPDCESLYGYSGVGYHNHELDILGSNVNAAGNNTLKAKASFVERSIYKTALYPKNTIEPIDTWYKKPFYGKIDRDMNSVFLVDNNLGSVLIEYEEESMFGLNFVVRAYEAFKEEVQDKVAKELITPPPGLGTLRVKSAYINVRSLYEDHRSAFQDFLVTSYMKSKRTTIKNFDDFVKELIILMRKMGRKFPILFSSYILSKGVPLNISGLVIDLDVKDVTSDANKLKFIKSEGFLWYANTAAKYGFFVDKNAPWRLVANLASDTMQGYMRRFGITPEKNTATEVFENYFIQAHLSDLRVLESFCYETYERFVEAFPHLLFPRNCRPHKGSKIFYTKNSQTPRRPLPKPETRGTRYDVKYWMDKLVRIKFLEFDLYNDINEDEIHRIVHRAHQFFKEDAMEPALDYINLQFKMRWPAFRFHQRNLLDTNDKIVLKDILSTENKKEERRDDYTAY